MRPQSGSFQAGSFQAKLPVPFGLLGIRTASGRIAEIVFLKPGGKPLAPCDGVAELACTQLQNYFSDPEFRFDLRLSPGGTAFQRRVWSKIRAIAPGRTRSYGAIAREIDSAARAVGQACGANPLPLVVPCHRVLAANGIGGFAHHEKGFHLSVKRWLLAHEGAQAAR
jgi:methylated-DNA-[protein]-cysteine S-methyltransferase